MARRIAAVVLCLGCLHAAGASALGLGELTPGSFLNEPFKAKIDLLNMAGLSEHQIQIRLATGDDFDRLGVDWTYVLTSMSFEIKVDDEGRGQILLTSQESVLEPYLNFVLEARWPTGRLLREYTVLVDPPVFQAGQSITISASSVVAQLDSSVAANPPLEASSGTEVQLGKSTLAERRNFGSDASPSAHAGERYLIRRNETLWKIAQRSRPDGTSIQQAMLDIQRLNPSAFIEGNINRIKAGYVIYLPKSNDISSDDLGSAMAEVRKQNQNWREKGSDSQSDTTGGSLRISTESTISDGPGQLVSDSSPDSGSATDMASMAGLELAQRNRTEVEARLDSMTEQVDTLERILSLKDDQIAALQKALAEVRASSSFATEPAEDNDTQISVADTDVEDLTAVQATTDVVVSEAPAKKAAVAVKSEEDSFFGSIMYILGGLVVLAVAVWAFLRRRGKDYEGADDVFANVQLHTDEHEGYAEQEQALNADYSQQKNDEYAPDADIVDALAEADIYITYGRFPQAVNLLKAAIKNAPANPEYKLKLMQVSSEMGDQTEVMSQFADIKRLGHAASVQRGEDIISGINNSADESAPQTVADTPAEADSLDVSDDLDLDLPLLDIEGGDRDLEEDLVYATESDTMSTNLDLARAYLDMGDHDGARAIFEQVQAEGSDEQKEEARLLLERLD